MKHAPSVARLIDALRTLPGVGPKSAQRMAFHLLQDGREGARRLSEGIDLALSRVGRCRSCRMFTESELCAICESTQRDASLLCVVESPADVVAIEQSGGYRGRYFVLMGHLSPLDGIGPEQLGVGELEALLAAGTVQELILATNPTVEGEATAHFLSEIARARGLRATRIAHGVPIGGELEYIDGGTLAHALAGRQSLGQ
jgi:recombination protein RecR